MYQCLKSSAITSTSAAKSASSKRVWAGLQTGYTYKIESRRLRLVR